MLANLGIMNSETWKAVREYCDGSKKDTGCSGHGVVIKAVDRECWITINKIAVPLKVSTALATEIAVASVLTEVLNLSVEKKSNMQTDTDCIKRIVDDSETENMWS